MRPIKLNIKNNSETYPIIIGSNLIKDLNLYLNKNLNDYNQCLLVIDTKIPKKMIFYKAKFATCDLILGQFWNPKWTRVFAQNFKKIYKRNQDEPKRAIMSFKESNNCL